MHRGCPASFESPNLSMDNLGRALENSHQSVFKVQSGEIGLSAGRFLTFEGHLEDDTSNDSGTRAPHFASSRIEARNRPRATPGPSQHQRGTGWRPPCPCRKPCSWHGCGQGAGVYGKQRRANSRSPCSRGYIGSLPVRLLRVSISAGLTQADS